MTSENKIDLKFALWWSGGKMSYLRYLTFKTLRHFHPNSEIYLYTCDKFSTNYKWNVEQQDFEGKYEREDHLDRLKDLDVIKKEINAFSQYTPNYQSDFFRWWWLSNNAGFYLDTDQIILKNFETLPLNSDFIYSEYPAKSCGIYTPVGVVGASINSKIVKWVKDILPKYYNSNDYNSVGPFMMRSVLHDRKWSDIMFNSPSHYFYPVPESYLVNKIYNGEEFFDKNKSFAAHWYGGHPESQKFNQIYTKKMLLNSNDSISTFLRQEGIS
jgi:hypothetical protein